jgi:hypothetical protein
MGVAGVVVTGVAIGMAGAGAEYEVVELDEPPPKTPLVARP